MNYRLQNIVLPTIKISSVRISRAMVRLKIAYYIQRILLK